jgi:hypothetical protein
MLLIRARPIISPRQAERLLANLWQLAVGARLGLHIIHLGSGEEAPLLAVSALNPALERDATDLVATGTQGQVQNADILPELICAAPGVGVYHLQPAARNLQTNSQSWGWDRADNLIHLYGLLRETPAGEIAGVTLVFFPFQNMQAATLLTAFAVGPAHREMLRHAYRLASTYAGTGVHVRRPIFQRRWLERAMHVEVSLGMAQMRRHGVIRVDEMSAFWHPPIGTANPAQPG